MKKSIIIAVMLMIISGIVYAQDLRLDGYFNTGLGFIADNQDGDANDARLRAFGVDSEQPGMRFRLNGTYANADGNAGFRFRFQAQTNYGGTSSHSFTGNVTVPDPTDPPDGTLTGTATGNVTVNNLFGYFSLPYLYGWVGFFENKLTVSGGIIEDNTWTTGDWYLASDSMNHFVGLGTLIKATPIDGLVLGVGAHLISRSGGGDNNRLQLADFGTFQFLQNTRFVLHAGYTMPDMFRVGLSYRTEGGTVADANADKVGSIGGDNSSRLYADVRLLAVENLTAVVAASFNNLGESKLRWNAAEDRGFTFKETGEIIISQTFAYRIEDIRFGLNMAQFLSNVEANEDATLHFNLWGSYTMNNLVPRLDLNYIMGGNSGANWHRRNFQVTRYDSDYSLFSIRPSIRMNIDSRTHLEIGNMLNIDSYPSGQDSITTNIFYVDLRWSF